jgi:hypothetical protein
LASTAREHRCADDPPGTRVEEDVGPVRAEGSAVYSGGTFTLNGAGFNYADGVYMQFMNQPFCDGSPDGPLLGIPQGGDPVAGLAFKGGCGSEFSHLPPLR